MSRMNICCLLLLQNWYAAQCDGDWEHQNGIKIETIDNPGWHLIIDLSDLHWCLSARSKKVQLESGGWLYWTVDKRRFDGACGPKDLDHLAREFLELASANETSE